MMTKEDVAQVIAYCDENKISYKQRLAELRINPWCEAFKCLASAQ